MVHFVAQLAGKTEDLVSERGPPCAWARSAWHPADPCSLPQALKQAVTDALLLPQHVSGCLPLRALRCACSSG